MMLLVNYINEKRGIGAEHTNPRTSHNDPKEVAMSLLSQYTTSNIASAMNIPLKLGGCVHD